MENSVKRFDNGMSVFDGMAWLLSAWTFVELAAKSGVSESTLRRADRFGVMSEKTIGKLSLIIHELEDDEMATKFPYGRS
jgi:hypothetical protein